MAHETSSEAGALAGRVALVTGAGKRLGRAIALHLARTGADVVVHHRASESEARVVVAEIEKMGRRALAIGANLESVGEIRGMIERAGADFGRLDVLVNSAATFFHTRFEETSEQIWDAALDTNLKAPFFCAQAAAPLLKKSRGAIINMADVGGLIGWTGYIPHSVSKAGMVMLTRCLAKALAPDVRVNAIAPGTISFPDDAPEVEAEYVRLAPLRRTGTPEEVCEAVSYLIGAEFVTGHVLVIDGGRTL